MLTMDQMNTKIFYQRQVVKEEFHLTDEGGFWKYLQLRDSDRSNFDLDREEEEESIKLS